MFVAGDPVDTMRQATWGALLTLRGAAQIPLVGHFLSWNRPCLDCVGFISFLADDARAPRRRVGRAAERTRRLAARGWHATHARRPGAAIVDTRRLTKAVRRAVPRPFRNVSKRVCIVARKSSASAQRPVYLPLATGSSSASRSLAASSARRYGLLSTYFDGTDSPSMVSRPCA